MSFVQIVEKKEDVEETTPFKIFNTVHEIFEEVNKHTVKEPRPKKKDMHIFNELICGVLPEMYEIVKTTEEFQFIDKDQSGFYTAFTQILLKHSSYMKRHENALDDDFFNDEGFDHHDD